MSGRSVIPCTTSVPSTTANAVNRMRSRYGNAGPPSRRRQRERRGERHDAAHAAPADDGGRRAGQDRVGRAARVRRPAAGRSASG